MAGGADGVVKRSLAGADAGVELRVGTCSTMADSSG
jgi:hypothetical protein